MGSRGGTVGCGTALQAGRSRVRFPMVSLEFFIDIILPVALWPLGGLHSLEQKCIPGIFPGEEGKDGRCVRLTTLSLLFGDRLEIWKLQTPGKLRAYPGLYRDYSTHVVSMEVTNYEKYFDFLHIFRSIQNCALLAL